LLAAFALIVIDYFPRDKFLQALCQSLLIFDFQREIVEIFNVLPQISTILASHHGACFASKNILKKILLASIFEKRLKSVKTKIQKLLSVFLFPDIRWLAIKTLETEAKWSWIIVLPIR